MEKRFTYCLTVFFLLFVSFFTAQNLDLNALEKEIIKYNREGKHTLSQKKLSNLLFSGTLTKVDEASVLFYMATTYRGVSDYMTCLDYLNKASAAASDLPVDHPLKMRLDYEYAFAYFDNKAYEKAKMAMDHIAAQDYIDVIPEDQAYILMQEGYLFLRKKDFDSAEKKYSEARQIMKTANYCNLPIVYIRMMDLYSRKNQLREAERMYSESMKIARSCGVLKYETYASSEMEGIYKQHNLLGKAYELGSRVDSLKKVENLESRVSEMHIIDKQYLEKKESVEQASLFWEKTATSVFALLLIIVILYSYKKSRKLKMDKKRMREKIARIQEDLNSYTQKPQNEEKFVGSEMLIPGAEQLTERQKELVQLMADGLSNKEIAAKLFITESTVKYHIKNIYSVLDLKDRKEFFKKIGGS